jgi:nitroreductase
METWDAIASRRNVREFSRAPVEAEALERILEAGRRSPSAGNSQPWDFILVTDAEARAALAGVWKGAWHVANAPAVIAVIAPSTTKGAILHFDLGQATMSMMIAAADLGLGTGHASVSDQDLARRILGFPEDRSCTNIISIGYPVDGPLLPVKNLKRRAFDDVVHRGRW